MKKTLKRIFALCLTLLLLAAVPSAYADDYATAVVKGGWLRLRSGASSEAETISAYYTGTTVTVLGGSGVWYHVRTPDGKTGYMHSGYLTLSSSITGGQLAENTAATVTSGNGKPVRLRTGPSTNYAIIASYAVGTPLTVLTTGETWCKIRINGQTGYMMTEFIDAGSTAGGYTAYVVSGNGKSVVLRSGPAKSYEAIASYNVGQKVTVNSYGAAWCQITVNGVSGYMMSEFLSTTKPATGTTGSTGTGSASSSYTAYVTSQNGKGVRMRSGAGKIYPTIATYSVGTKVTVLEYGKTWCKIKIGSNTGYMMTEFLTTAKTSTAVQTVKINTASAVPGDVLYTQLTPADASVTYEWYNDKGQQVGSGSTYTVKDSDAGRKIRVCATGTGTTTGTAVSGWATIQSSYVSLVYQLKSVTISDTTPTVGQTLTATLSPAGATATISWFRDNGVFVGSGASYRVTSSDAGYKLYAWADGTGSTTGDVTSERTVAVAEAAVSTIVLQGVSISHAAPRSGDTLTATLSPANASASFTWRSSAGHILGYGESYTVTDNEIGQSIYVYANGTNNTSGSVVSGLTAAVQAKVETTLRIDAVTLNSTTPTVGQTLYVTLTPANASATYTWLRDDDKILTTNAYYTVQADDLGHSIYVWADGADGTFGSATSQITSPVTN